MKAAFFHDSILKWSDKDGKYYTNGGLTNVYLRRYFEFFDSLTMVTRKETLKDSDDLRKMSISSGDGIEFDCVGSIGVKAIISDAIKNKIHHVLEDVDFAIIRLPSVIGILACIECDKLGKPYIVEVVGSPFCALWYYGKIS